MGPVLGAEQKPVLGDIRFERKDMGEESENAMFPPSIFSHWKHRINYRCDACHDSLFKMEMGANLIKMEQIKQGESCGVCHNGTVAFDSGYVNCNRCHVAYLEAQ